MANFEAEELDIAIYNPKGEIVMHNLINRSNKEINIQFLPKGIYIIEIKCPERSVRQQLIKE